MLPSHETAHKLRLVRDDGQRLIRPVRRVNDLRATPRDDFEHPVIKKWFYPGVAALLVMGALLQWGFITGYQDNYGKATGCINGLVEVVLLIAMLLRRNSLKGQSFYIALFMLVGNIFGYFMSLQPNPTPPQVADIYIHVMFACILPLHVAYLILVYRQCRLDGVNPWRRF